MRKECTVDLRVIDHPQATVVEILEELDTASSATLGQTLVQLEMDGKRAIVVSLEACPFVDASGLTTLLYAHRRLRERFRLVLPTSQSCRRILEIAGFADAPFVFTSLPAALADGP
jgi:anti-anti-sigma factor